MAREPIFFDSPQSFRKWLEENHRNETEVIVGYYKVKTGKPTMTWSDSVDEALCFGWIDGIRKSIDDESYCNRFTPRNPKSNWSAVNIKKVEELIRLGKMTPAGLAAFEKRTKERSEVYSYENKPEQFSPELKARFCENVAAWEFFEQQSTSYKRTAMYYVMSAKQETTRFSRLEKLIQACTEGKRIY
ncbi:MAG: YdeI/OmpD-associated family protein [Prolixibacteraceae bacterium]|nr:YdeI/OmpD-associated family protein [Prolixibacteraceae bacterium]